MTRKALIAAMLVSAGAFAAETALPPNLDPGAFRSAFEEMATRSETFRRQCDRLRAAPHLRVTVERDLHRNRRHRAHTAFVRTRGVTVHAIVTISATNGLVEVLAHEVEHILEQLDGVDLNRSSRHVAESDGVFETRRAIVMGRTVADEVESARKAPDRPSRVRP